MPSDFDLCITTRRLFLRRVEHHDFLGLLDIYSNPRTAMYDFGLPRSTQQVEDMMREQANVHIGDIGSPILLVTTTQFAPEVIGVCELTINDAANRQGSIGFHFNPKFGGQGFATEAARATIDFGFRRLKLHRIQAAADNRNERSWKSMERLGMRREAHLHQLQLTSEGDTSRIPF